MKTGELEQNNKTGHLHPISQAIREIESIFAKIGFSVAEGPEVETEFYNFDSLNVPADHPSRDMQDTFWMTGNENRKSGEKLLLRTQTSAVQVRYIETHTPPFQIIIPGKVFRNEATDVTHEAEFYQIEGLKLQKKVSLADLKGDLEYFFKALLGDDIKVRFRPSFFPFVEPGVEVDIWFKDKWLEVMGAGLVHPNVLKAGGLNPDEWQGYAFGGGIDRLLMLKYGIDDIRHIYSGDLRFVNQF